MKAYRIINIIVILAVALSSLAASSMPSVFEQEGGDEINRDSQYVPGEVVIGLPKGKSAEAYRTQASSLARSVGGQVVDAYSETTLIQFAEDADVPSLVQELSNSPGVEFAEPNYVYWLPEPLASPEGGALNTDYVLRRKPMGVEGEMQGKDLVAIPAEALTAMRTKRAGNIQAVWPNDPYLWWNWGWDWVGASIVWPNATASAGVCVLDTGVDYNHPDLGLSTAGGVVIKGTDFVNGDANPMDDFGHGTHVAGIIAAKMNNNQGISGVSNGKVVAVKVLTSQGWGTNFDIAAGINFCANRTDVKVLNLSLGGTVPSTLMYNAINYAVNIKGKLIVAAAGNNDSDVPIYPAGFADITNYPQFANKVLAVAAAGTYYGGPDEWYPECRAWYSNYGEWVSVVAPGTEIYSTMPWDKPFYMQTYYGNNTRYDWMNGTSMAAPFVAGSAARRWGYKPAATNSAIGLAVKESGWEINADDWCWPATMSGIHFVNVADLLDRGAIYANAFDSSTGLPLDGATIQAYQGATLRGSGVLTPDTWTEPGDPMPSRVYMWFNDIASIINLPVGTGYEARINKTGYTASPQTAYRHAGDEIYGGDWHWWGRTGVPPMSGNFDAVLGWWWMVDFDGEYGIVNEPSISDLDLDIWLPAVPNPLDPGQPAPFIVGSEGNAFGYLEGDSYGAMTAFPFARWLRDGGSWDVRLEDSLIRKRLAHGTLAANTALPYYPGDYEIMATDWGQTINHDDDDGTTPEIPLMGVYFVPHLYIWKDGLIKKFVDMDDYAPIEPYSYCNAEWWNAATIHSGVSGAPTYTINNTCGDDTIVPYFAEEFTPTVKER